MADKEAAIYIIDVGRSMGKRHNGRDETDLEWSMQWVWDKITTTISTGRKTLMVGIVGVRTTETNNKLGEQDAYRHISVLSPIKMFQMEDVRRMQALIKPSATENGDVISALAIAIQMMVEHCKHLKWLKKINIVTNARGLIDADDTEPFVVKLRRDGIELTILGVDFDDANFGVKEEDKHARKAENERVLKKLAEDAGGRVGTMAEAVSELGEPRVRTVRPVPLFKGSLTLGDPTKYETAMTIKVHRYPRVKVAKPPTARSFVVRQNMAPSQSHAGLVSVKNARTYQVEDADVPGGKRDVEFDSLAKGYEYGRTAVAMSESDMNVTELETIAGMEIVGFVPKDNLERYMHMSESSIVIADPIDDMQKMALSSLIHALHELESYAIARYVRKDGIHPVLFVLAPRIEGGSGESKCSEYFVDAELPFAEDIRQHKFPPLDRVVTVAGKSITRHRNVPEPGLQRAMDEYVDSMDLATFDKNAQDQRSEYAAINDTFSPVLHHINHAIRRRAVHPTHEVPKPHAILTKYARPPAALIRTAQPYLDAVMRHGNVKPQPPKPKPRGRGGAKREAEKPLSGLDIDALLQGGEGRGARRRGAISAQNAIPEFKQLLATTEDEAEIVAAVGQMQAHIEGYITTSVGESGYGRAVEALRVVREEMVDLDCAGWYNSMMRTLKGKILGGELGGERREMWGRVRANRLGLVVTDGGDATAEEAREFLSGRVAA